MCFLTTPIYSCLYCNFPCCNQIILSEIQIWQHHNSAWNVLMISYSFLGKDQLLTWPKKPQWNRLNSREAPLWPNLFSLHQFLFTDLFLLSFCSPYQSENREFACTHLSCSLYFFPPWLTNLYILPNLNSVITSWQSPSLDRLLKADLDRVPHAISGHSKTLYMHTQCIPHIHPTHIPGNIQKSYFFNRHVFA